MLKWMEMMTYYMIYFIKKWLLNTPASASLRHLHSGWKTNFLDVFLFAMSRVISPYGLCDLILNILVEIDFFFIFFIFVFVLIIFHNNPSSFFLVGFVFLYYLYINQITKSILKTPNNNNKKTNIKLPTCPQSKVEDLLIPRAIKWKF